MLPAPAYARGFLRSYAGLLELDPERLLDELNPALAEHAPPPPPARRLPVARRTLAIGGAAVTLLAGLALLGLNTGGRSPPVPHPPPAAAPKSAVHRPHPAATPASRAKAPALVLAATRGDCWLSVRRNSSAGAVVWQGLLHRGSSLRFGRLPLWIRMGAPWNLEATLGGRTLAALPSGRQPANVLLTVAGQAPA